MDNDGDVVGLCVSDSVPPWCDSSSFLLETKKKMMMRRARATESRRSNYHRPQSAHATGVCARFLGEFLVCSGVPLPVLFF